MILHPLTMPRVSLSSAMARHKNINSLIDMMMWANKGDIVGGCKFSNLPNQNQKVLSYNIKTHL